MQLHIKFPKSNGFYFVISRKKPYEKEIVKTDRNPDGSILSDDQMEHNLDRVNFWIGNCDQKASFLLALVGVVITVIFTNGFVDIAEGQQNSLLHNAIKSGVASWDTLHFIIIILFGLGFICLLVAILYLVFCLYARISYINIRERNPGLESPSTLFFGSISKMSYLDFSLNKYDLYNDYRSQVFINSIICTKKFVKYKVGLVFTIVALVLLSLSFIFSLFV